MWLLVHYHPADRAVDHTIGRLSIRAVALSYMEVSL
nr:MAG TPA: hypothetical protein [Caudoviricetes sp.]